MGGLIFILLILGIAVPIVLGYFIIKALIDYTARKTAEEIVKKLNLREEIKAATWEAVNGIHFDAIARIFIEEARKAESEK